MGDRAGTQTVFVAAFTVFSGHLHYTTAITGLFPVLLHLAVCVMKKDCASQLQRYSHKLTELNLLISLSPS